MPAEYLDLQNRVLQLLKRQRFTDAFSNDITSIATGMFIGFAMTSLQRYVPVPMALEVSAQIVIGPTAMGGVSNHPYGLWQLPYPFRYEYDIWASSAGGGITPAKPLKRYNTIRDYHKDFPDPRLNVTGAPQPGAPQAFVFYNNQLYLGPYPDKNYTFVMDYVQWLPPLANPTDVNWYTLNADDALTYLAAKEAAIWLQEDSLIQMFKDLAKEKIQDVLRTLREHETSEGDMKAELMG